MTMTKKKDINILDLLVRQREELANHIHMIQERVDTTRVEYEDTCMIEDENDKRIEEQKCSDQYENSKEELEVEEEKLDFHDEVASYLGTLISGEEVGTEPVKMSADATPEQIRQSVESECA